MNSVRLANAPAPQVPRLSSLFLMYILRTKNRTTPRKAMTRMVTMAAMPPPEIPLDEPDAASALDAALVAEGMGVGAKVLLLLLVVGVVIGNEMAGVGVAVVEITDDDVNNGVSSVAVGRSVESVASPAVVGKSVAVAGSIVAFGSVVVKGSKAGSVDRSPRPSSVTVKAGSLGSIVKEGKLSPLRRRFPK